MNRIKSGNPGFFVAYNPSNEGATPNFSEVPGLPEQLTVSLLSDNYNIDAIVEKYIRITMK